MPTKPKTYRPPGYRNPAQLAKAYDDSRGTAQQRGYTARWARYSKARLLEHPLCVLCLSEGRQVIATCTDHIKPASKYPDLFWDTDNHQSLCSRHNAIKGSGD